MLHLTFSVIILENIYWKLLSPMVWVNSTQGFTKVWYPRDGALEEVVDICKCRA